MEREKLLVFLLVAPILLAQGIWMFIDAEKNGLNKWLWGLLGLVQFPTYLIIYLLVKNRKKRRDALD